MKIARTTAPVILPHVVKLAREMFVEGVPGANRRSVAHPIAHAEVIEGSSEMKKVNCFLPTLNGCSS